MSLAPLLALPVVGGFVFCTIFKITRYRIARQDGHKLYFSVIWYALFLALAATALHAISFAHFPLYRSAIDAVSNELWKNGREEIFGNASILSILVGSFFLGPITAYVLNIPFEIARFRFLGAGITGLSEKFHSYVLDEARKHDYMEQLIVKAMEMGIPIMVTLQSGKIYVGFSLGLMDPTESRKSFKLLPLMSGYRDAKHNIKFTTEYFRALRKVQETNPIGIEDLFSVVIEADQVCTARMFDLGIYKTHFSRPRKRRKKPASKSTTTP